MGSKISLLVNECPLIKCKIWYMNGSIFQNLSQICSNVRTFWKKLVILFKFVHFIFVQICSNLCILFCFILVFYFGNFVQICAFYFCSNLFKFVHFIFVQNCAQNWADWYLNGLLFLEKLVFEWVCFQIPWRHIPTKTKLEYPPGCILKSRN